MKTISEKDKKKAEFCLRCPICKRARIKQKGLAYWFVRHVEPLLKCPNCSAYERVYGKKAWEPVNIP